MFTKISESFEVQEPFKERLSGFETLPFSRESLPELNEAMEEFFEKASRIAKKHKRKTDVYHLGIHFINLTSHAPRSRPAPGAEILTEKDSERKRMKYSIASLFSAQSFGQAFDRYAG